MALVVLTGAVGLVSSQPVFAKSANEVSARCVALELYFRSSDERAKESVEAIQTLVAQKRGVHLKTYDLDQDRDATNKDAILRVEKIQSYFRLPPAGMPVLYGMNRAFSGVAEASEWKHRLTEMLRMEVFTRLGCSRCASAKRFLPSFQTKYPGLQVEILEVLSDPSSNQRFMELANQQRIGGVSFPGFWLCQQMVVGFDSEQAVASRLDGILKKWTFDCQLPPAGVSRLGDRHRNLAAAGAIASWASLIRLSSTVVASQVPGALANVPDEPTLPLPAATDATEDRSEAPPIDIGEPMEVSESVPNHDDTESVEVPLLGRLSVKKLGMPLFTVLIGLVDGFNPCAMWVLVFLLSVLVNLHDRWKILAVAGTFVVISGVAYFAFMAAWLNVLLLVGFLRWVQVLLAILAILVGAVHVKDFFAFHRGITFSIPESAKPGIYERVRNIVMANNLVTAIAGASILAILVNVIELLCTAGLPALYSQVLSLQNYPVWMNYGFLGLYIVAYMFDDSLMVTAVVITLGRKKLQETEGRWLKLISGLVILSLGFVLLVKPEWLE